MNNLNQYYEGYFLKDQFDGVGYFQWENGDSYYGSWIKSTRNGYGVYLKANGDVFKGTWVNDL